MKKAGKAVEEAIADFGGQMVRDIVVGQLKRRFNLDPGDAVERPEEFVAALRDIYGSFEQAVERRICERLASEFGISYRGEGLVELTLKVKARRA